MMIDICKLFILLLLNSSCITHKEQLQSNAEISLRTTLQEVNADSGLVMLMDSAGNVIAKSSLSLLNGKSLEEEVYTTVRDMGTLAVPVSLIPVLEKGNVSLLMWVMVYIITMEKRSGIIMRIWVDMEKLPYNKQSCLIQKWV